MILELSMKTNIILTKFSSMLSALAAVTIPTVGGVCNWNVCTWYCSLGC